LPESRSRVVEVEMEEAEAAGGDLSRDILWVRVEMGGKVGCGV
jgi:hypothetical protein